jgi:REP-associated tyrosine transposase
MRTDYPRHLPAFEYRGAYRYFLTFCTCDRRHAFTEAAAVDLVRGQFLRAADRHLFALLAYCFMPDHVHLLVEGTREDSSLKEFQSAAKQYSGFHYRAQFGRRLWQRYGFERVLRSEESTIDVVRYILANPVRAGLTRRMDEYSFSGSSVFSIDALMEGVQDHGPAKAGRHD